MRISVRHQQRRRLRIDPLAEDGRQRDRHSLHIAGRRDAAIEPFVFGNRDRAIAILANCRKAMAPSATLLIVERVVPERAEQARAAEAYLVDLEMLAQAPGGRELTESEFRAILSAAELWDGVSIIST
jgi:O-methyltransferase domain